MSTNLCFSWISDSFIYGMKLIHEATTHTSQDIEIAYVYKHVHQSLELSNLEEKLL